MRDHWPLFAGGVFVLAALYAEQYLFEHFALLAVSVLAVGLLAFVDWQGW